jgi:hypothetical protein
LYFEAKVLFFLVVPRKVLILSGCVTAAAIFAYFQDSESEVINRQLDDCADLVWDVGFTGILEWIGA